MSWSVCAHSAGAAGIRGKNATILLYVAARTKSIVIHNEAYAGLFAAWQVSVGYSDREAKSMFPVPVSPILESLKGRITLDQIPFSDRGSRLLLFRKNSGLAIRLAERWVQWEKDFDIYSRRLPFVDDITLQDENGAPLDFDMVSYPHALFAKTRAGVFWISFANEESLYIRFPAARCGIKFRVYAAGGRTDRRGGVFRGTSSPERVHRNIAYTTDAQILSNQIQPDANGYRRVELQVDATTESGMVLNITAGAGLDRSVPASSDVVRAAEQRWQDWFGRVPRVGEPYAAQYYFAWWILGAGLLSPRSYLTREAMVPSLTHYVGVWTWDAFFHALAYRHVDTKLAEDQLRVLIDHQREDGMIPDAVDEEEVVARGRLPGSVEEMDMTKPPLMAWVALKLYETSGHRDFLQEIYEPICRWNHWWLEKNDDDRDGIVQYNHPYSSGLDDSPLWDEGMPVESPDLNTYLILQMDALGRMADIIGLPEQAGEWRLQADRLTRRLIAHSWDERAGVFWAMHDHQPIRALTPFSLYPLITGRLSRGMTERLVARLCSPDEFWTRYPLATVARSDPRYTPDLMWRGPTWVNVNYLFIAGLMQSGYLDTARELRDKTLDLLMAHSNIYEFYNPETGNPPGAAASVFGWSSAIFVDLSIQASRGRII